MNNYDHQYTENQNLESDDYVHVHDLSVNTQQFDRSLMEGITPQPSWYQHPHSLQRIPCYPYTPPPSQQTTQMMTQNDYEDLKRYRDSEQEKLTPSKPVNNKKKGAKAKVIETTKENEDEATKCSLFPFLYPLCFSLCFVSFLQ